METVFPVHCVYLLKSLNPKHRGRYYIGYTNNPRNRLKQHNGEKPGGAKKTRTKRPWDIVVFVQGFVDEVTALQFEWAMQNPQKSKFLKSAKNKEIENLLKRNSLNNRIRLLYIMACSSPFRCMELEFHWRDFDFWSGMKTDLSILGTSLGINFEENSSYIEENELETYELQNKKYRIAMDSFEPSEEFCFICKKRNRAFLLKCLSCELVYHALCIDQMTSVRKGLIPAFFQCADTKCNIKANWVRFIGFNKASIEAQKNKRKDEDLSTSFTQLLINKD